MPVFRWNLGDGDGSSTFMLVQQKKRLSDTAIEFIGFEMQYVGIGCHNDLDTKAYPNAFGIARLKIANELCVTRVGENAIEVFVVLESLVTKNKLFAIGDTMLPLYMINALDCLSFRNSFEVNFHVISTDEMKANGYYDRHILYKHYHCLVTGYLRLRQKLRCGTDDNSTCNVTIFFDDRMMDRTIGFLKERGIYSFEKEASQPCESKLINGDNWLKVTMSYSTRQLRSFALLDLIKSLFGESALWCVKDHIGGYVGSLLANGGISYRLFVSNTRLHQITFHDGGLVALSVEMSTRKMQSDRDNPGHVFPFNKPKEKALLSSTKETTIQLADGEVIHLQPYFICRTRGQVCRLVHTIEMQTAVCKEEQKQNGAVRCDKRLATTIIQLECESMHSAGSIFVMDPSHG